MQLRVLEIVPPPQVTVQTAVDQAPQFPLTVNAIVQLYILQYQYFLSQFGLLGHGFSAQSRVTVSPSGLVLQGSPPFSGAGLVHVLVLEMVAPPQVLGQAVQADQSLH